MPQVQLQQSQAELQACQKALLDAGVSLDKAKLVASNEALLQQQLQSVKQQLQAAEHQTALLESQLQEALKERDKLKAAETFLKGIEAKQQKEIAELAEARLKAVQTAEVWNN